MGFSQFITENLSYINLGIEALIPVAASVVLFILDTKTPFKKLPHMVKQIIFGVIFGAIAIVGTEWGIPIDGAVVNVRDAAPLCAGLLFGGHAGIIAGVIGGVERWFAVYWGVGEFTRIACSISTVLAGIFAAVLRKVIFDNRRPGFLLAFASGVVMEVIHLTMVFLTNLGNAVKASEVVKACTIPMVVANGLSVLLATALVEILSGSARKEKKKAHISEKIQRGLMICVVLAYLITTTFMAFVQTGITESETEKNLRASNADIIEEIDAERAKDPEIMIINRIVELSRHRHVMENGYLIIGDGDGTVRWAPDGIDAEAVAEKAMTEEENALFRVKTEQGRQFALFNRYQGGCYIISVISTQEAMRARDTAIYVNTFMEIIVFAVMFTLIYLSVKNLVVKKVADVNRSLDKITKGDLDEKVDVRSTAEFDDLSENINGVVSTLKGHIDAEAEKNAQELEVAKNIQASALPSVFPAFPGRREFDVYALMTPAKEVGGDFYDFYITEGNLFYFAVADVSGKGIPAAMFMMRAKTELKSLAESGLSIDEIMTRANDALCDGNDAGMFVTAWMGAVNLETGLMSFVNAGHNPPLVKHKDGSFDYLRRRSGLVLAGIEGVQYKKQEIQLKPGDVIFLYTDGVTEATNAQVQLYGEERLKNILNTSDFANVKEVCDTVKKDVDDFVGEAPQFDDITMLCAKFECVMAKKEMHFDKVATEDITVITETVENTLTELGFPMKAITQVNVAIDEVYSNIVKFSYGGREGPATVLLEEKKDPEGVMLTFIDEGVPYNPLNREDPDVTLGAEERSVGGLGIFMVKKMMDEITYEYRNNKNILHLFKKK